MSRRPCCCCCGNFLLSGWGILALWQCWWLQRGKRFSCCSSQVQRHILFLKWVIIRTILEQCNFFSSVWSFIKHTQVSSSNHRYSSIMFLWHHGRQWFVMTPHKRKCPTPPPDMRHLVDFSLNLIFGPVSDDFVIFCSFSGGVEFFRLRNLIEIGIFTVLLCGFISQFLYHNQGCHPLHLENESPSFSLTRFWPVRQGSGDVRFFAPFDALRFSLGEASVARKK